MLWLTCFRRFRLVPSFSLSFLLVTMTSRKKKVIRKVKTPRVNPIETIVNPIPTKKGCPNFFEVPIRRYKRATLGPEYERSKIHEAYLERLRNSILSRIVLGWLSLALMRRVCLLRLGASPFTKMHSMQVYDSLFILSLQIS